MIFKDRRDAGEKLLETLKKNKSVQSSSNTVVVSLLRGGVVIGNAITRGLKGAVHLPLVVAKIPAPENPELAIGALCFDVVYLEKKVVESLGIERFMIRDQIEVARQKLNSYIKRFSLKEDHYGQNLKDSLCILTDDGVATGSTVKAALLYLRTKKPESLFLAIPIAPADFDTRGFDNVFILYKDPMFSAVSQFYERFPQVEDEEVKKILRS
ncbi:hypothetical protein HYW87_02830 [Candidatus Roizmanbacteria bacterium]|nr:hypothetical protein [Candidatus Roizmanbacteria bacterium]